MILCENDNPHLQPEVLTVFRAFRAAAQAQKALLHRALALHGSSPTEAMCLRVLMTQPGVTQKELADLLHISPSRITATLQELERRGQVVRAPDELDQRLTRVHLTEAGRSRAEELRGVFGWVLGRTLGSLPGADLLRAKELLEHIAMQSSKLLCELEKAGGPEGTTGHEGANP